MKTFVATTLAFASTTLGFVARQNTCCFSLTASGGASGVLGQLADGQNRVGGNYPAGSYCINGQGGLIDASGRGCILTPPTSQFQCDKGASPTSGFSVACNGAVSQGGNAQFYACPTGQGGSYNVYTKSIDSSCVKIALTANNCHSNCPTTSSSSTSTSKPATTPTPAPAPAPSPSAKTCPAALSGTYEFPHLITPVNSASPNQAYGTSYNGQITSTISSIFNFDIPAADSGKTCTLVFLFPKQSSLQTSSFTFSGSGAIDFSLLSAAANAKTTFANQPSVKTDYGVTTVAPGNSYTIASFSCPAGQSVAFELKASDSTSLTYFQDYNPSPIGLYITVC